jgi:replicative DNA helicase
MSTPLTKKEELQKQIDEALMNGQTGLWNSLMAQFRQADMEEQLASANEDTLIRAMVTDPDGCERALKHLVAEDFTDVFSQEIFKIILSLYHRNIKVTADSLRIAIEATSYPPAPDRSLMQVLSDKLSARARSDERFKNPVVALLLKPGIPTDLLTAKIREASIRRSLNEEMIRFAQTSCMPNADLQQVMSEHERAIGRLTDRLAGSLDASGELVSWYDTELEVIAVRKDADKRGSELGFKTPLRKLNRTLNPFVPQDFVIIAARPSVGKTSLAVQFAWQMSAQSKPMSGLFVSLEMSRTKLAERRLLSASGLSRLEMNNLDWRKSHSTEIYERLETAAEQSMMMPLLILDVPSITPSELLIKAREARRQLNGLDVIFIDYAKMDDDEKTKQDTPMVAHVAKGLKRIAKTMNCVVIALAQIGRKYEDRQGKTVIERPKLSDMRDSGWLEQEADCVIMLHQPNLDDPTLVEVGITKQRDGAREWEQFGFSPRRTWFYNSQSDIPEDGYPQIFKDEGE